MKWNIENITKPKHRFIINTTTWLSKYQINISQNKNVCFALEFLNICTQSYFQSVRKFHFYFLITQNPESKAFMDSFPYFWLTILETRQNISASMKNIFPNKLSSTKLCARHDFLNVNQKFYLKIIEVTKTSLHACAAILWF